MSLKGLGLINVVTNDGFYKVAESIYKQYSEEIDAINDAIAKHCEDGYILAKLETGSASPLQNYYEAIGYKVVIHTGRTKDTIAIGWEI